MNVIVVGLGRMGTGLARKLDRQGHNVCAVDQDPERLELLGDGFAGRKVCGASARPPSCPAPPRTRRTS